MDAASSLDNPCIYKDVQEAMGLPKHNKLF